MAFLTINASAIHRPTIKTDGEQQAAYAANECCEPILMWCAPGSSTPLMMRDTGIWSNLQPRVMSVFQSMKAMQRFSIEVNRCSLRRPPYLACYSIRQRLSNYRDTARHGHPAPATTQCGTQEHLCARSHMCSFEIKISRRPTGVAISRAICRQQTTCSGVASIIKEKSITWRRQIGLSNSADTTLSRVLHYTSDNYTSDTKLCWTDQLAAALVARRTRLAVLLSEHDTTVRYTATQENNTLHISTTRLLSHWHILGYW